MAVAGGLAGLAGPALAGPVSEERYIGNYYHCVLNILPNKYDCGPVNMSDTIRTVSIYY